MTALNLLSNTSTVAKTLVSTQVSATTETTLYTVPANSAVTMKSGVICNTSGSAVTVSLSIVAAGGTGGTTNRAIAGYSLGANDSLDLRGYLTGAVLGENDFLSILVSTGSVVDVVITGLLSS